MTDEAAALAYINHLAKFSFKRREDVDEIVERKFREVLREAPMDCSFYRGRRFSRQFLTKDDVRNNIHAGMINRKYVEHPDLVFDRTSGSIGDTVPYAYLRGFHRYARMVFPFLINWGWKWAEKYCVFTTVHCSKDRCSTDDIPDYVNRVKIPTSQDIFMDEEALARAGAILQENQGTIVHGDPFYLCAVASYLDRDERRFPLKGISSTYEFLTSYVKRYLERIFQCRVFDSYGCSELGSMAFACPQGGKHIFEDCVFIEVVDQGRYIDPDVGEIVVTSLENPAMPLIRYRTGDLGKLITDPCGCKRTAKMIEIYGRDSQHVFFQGVFYSERDIAGLMDIPGVLLYQLSQSERDLVFHILLEKGYAGDGERRKIEQAIKDRFGKLGAGRMSVDFVSHIRPEKSGKFKTVVSSLGVAHES